MIEPHEGAVALWQAAMELAGDSRQMQALLQQGRAMSWQNDVLIIEVAGPSRSVVEQRSGEIEHLLRQATGTKVSLRVVAPAHEEHDSDNAKLATQVSQAESVDPVEVAQHEPLVQQAMKLFNGSVESAFLRNPSQHQ